MERYDSSDLARHGIQMIDPHAVYVAREVNLARISTEGVTLMPGTRISGSETLLCAGSTVGGLGPVVLHDVALGVGAQVQRGSAVRATLLNGAELGPDAHVRFGTVLEECASTAHATGLKQTIMNAFACVGSNVNLCDCYLGGGRSQTDHSEVGSGFIHFNFTPFGEQGDKATASVFGPVPKSVLLDAERVFLGGAGGVVGPVELGFGSVLAAGGVYRKSYGDGQMVLGEPARAKVVSLRAGFVPGIRRRLVATRSYIGQLMSLISWYRSVRLERAANIWEKQLIEHALERLDEGVKERLKQGDRLIGGVGSVDEGSVDAAAVAAWPSWCQSLEGYTPPPPPKVLAAAVSGAGAHVDWVRALSQDVAVQAEGWLAGIAEGLPALGTTPPR